MQNQYTNKTNRANFFWATRGIYRQVLPQIPVEKKFFSIKKIRAPLARIIKFRLLPNRFGVFGVAYRFKPSIFIILRVAFYCQVRKPAVGSRPVPMHYIWRNLHNIPLFERPCGLALLLIKSLAANRNEYLPSRMAMPIIAATGLKSYIRNRNAKLGIFRKRRQI